MRVLIIFCLFACLASCRESLQHEPDPLTLIEDDSIREILQKAWGHLGGWDQYEKLDSVVYRKHTILYLKDGTIELESKQDHIMQLKPSLSGSLVTQDSISRLETIKDHSGYYKKKDGSVINDSEQSARNSFLSAHFVLFAPFKIADPGTTLSLMEQDTINDRIVDVIRATWNPEKFDNHSTSDTWYLHFDRTTGQFLSYMVYHSPTYAMVHNHETSTYKGLLMPAYRETWRVDERGTRQYLRGEFWYQY